MITITRTARTIVRISHGDAIDVNGNDVTVWRVRAAGQLTGSAVTPVDESADALDGGAVYRDLGWNGGPVRG